MLLNCARVGINGSAMRIVVHSSPCCQGVKTKIYFQNIHLWLFENRFIKAALCQGAASKTTTFLESTWKMSSSDCSNFSFFYNVNFGRQIGLGYWQHFIKNPVFPVFSCLQKWSNGFSLLTCCRLSQDKHGC